MWTAGIGHFILRNNTWFIVCLSSTPVMNLHYKKDLRSVCSECGCTCLLSMRVAICFNVFNVCIWAKSYMHVLQPGLSSCLCLQVDCGYLCVFTESEIKACVCSNAWVKTLKGVKSASLQQLAALISSYRVPQSYTVQKYVHEETKTAQPLYYKHAVH